MKKLYVLEYFKILFFTSFLSFDLFFIELKKELNTISTSYLPKISVMLQNHLNCIIK